MSDKEEVQERTTQESPIITPRVVANVTFRKTSDKSKSEGKQPISDNKTNTDKTLEEQIIEYEQMEKKNECFKTPEVVDENGTEESMKVLHCVLALRGTGATWVNNSPFRNGGGNFELFENRLIEDRFISKLMPFEFFIFKAFNYQLLAANESPSAYADVVVNNLQKANVTDPLTCFCTALYNGLPEELQVYIMMDNDPNKLTK
eukprot:Nk52_evm1s1569 gene=Nk52_evmTU1s1569